MTRRRWPATAWLAVCLAPWHLPGCSGSTPAVGGDDGADDAVDDAADDVPAVVERSTTCSLEATFGGPRAIDFCRFTMTPACPGPVADEAILTSVPGGDSCEGRSSCVVQGWHWTLQAQPAGSTVTLTSPFRPETRMVHDAGTGFDRPGDYVVDLEATDDLGAPYGCSMGITVAEQASAVEASSSSP